MATNFGFVESPINNNTFRYTTSATLEIPKKFSYKKVLPAAINQGDAPTCVPSSLLTYLNWMCNKSVGKKMDNKIQYLDIFKNSPHSDDGMSFIDAFYYLRHTGVKSKKGILKIETYALVGSLFGLKSALIANGPCFAALPVYSTSATDFWNKNYGPLQGYHAITIVGYDEEGFIIRNSWGTSYGKDGYAHISEEDARLFHEIWTIFS